jgi:hypothetical protein
VSLGRETVAKAAVGQLGIRDESDARGQEPVELRRALGLPKQDEDGACDVVRAVTVLPSRRSQLRMLEDADVVAELEQMGERRRRDSQRATPACSETTASTRVR